MTRKEIDHEFRYLDSWHTTTEDLRCAFAKEMWARHYGYEPLLDAFVWFRCGWGNALKVELCA